ncbi:nuclear transport factor 2 family protein [Nesterenkonia sp. CL21]|uniref:nuclear transport factor 2 family protein n=1 Tax=Nesterenkonia sp. CL21 TaxID=3064894 RepID=UPI002878B80F|nr:nuclear transport factor 2 family protein [Nesterenkonia sp. CL21]MDS2172182.1 nuclear transport factor 2 family protein [Nesterenkonia sp. CL21]
MDHGHLQTLETELLAPTVRADRRRLDVLLHPDFHEIGRSGRHVSREEILDALPHEERTAPPVPEERRADDVGPGLVLLTYRLTDPVSGRRSRHCSLWETTPEPRLRYHQGTWEL